MNSKPDERDAMAAGFDPGMEVTVVTAGGSSFNGWVKAWDVIGLCIGYQLKTETEPGSGEFNERAVAVFLPWATIRGVYEA